ncbi:MAG: DUF6941 family protein [Gaiellaceae bacterium]
MKLAWMMLANHAESAPNGLLYMNGATWDTINVQGPLALPPEHPAAHAGAVAVFQGSLVLRLLFHPTETGRQHSITITIVDEDGGTVAKADATVDIQLQEDLPAGWDQGINLALPFTGLPLPRFGLYRASVQVDEQHLDDLPFRVVKRY